MKCECQNHSWHRTDSWSKVLTNGVSGDGSGEKAGPRLFVQVKKVGFYAKGMAVCYK